MALQNRQDQDMSLVLSSDAKPRLKWTPELQQRFVHAVAQLGGADKATPKSLMRVMGIHGLTLYHLKSHFCAFLFLNVGWVKVSNHKFALTMTKKNMKRRRGVTPVRIIVMEPGLRLMRACK